MSDWAFLRSTIDMLKKDTTMTTTIAEVYLHCRFVIKDLQNEKREYLHLHHSSWAEVQGVSQNSSYFFVP